MFIIYYIMMCLRAYAMHGFPYFLHHLLRLCTQRYIIFKWISRCSQTNGLEIQFEWKRNEQEWYYCYDACLKMSYMDFMSVFKFDYCVQIVKVKNSTKLCHSVDTGCEYYRVMCSWNMYIHINKIRLHLWYLSVFIEMYICP